MTDKNSVKNFFDNLYNETPKENIINLYSNWAEHYEDDVVKKPNGYIGYRIISKIVDLFAPETSIEILDIAAGTGLVGQELRKLNYLNIDAMDPCNEMLIQARKTLSYRNIFCQFPTSDTNDPLHGKYDQVCIAGGFSRKHMDHNDIIKLIKYAKIDGYISFTFRYEAIFSYQINVPVEINRLEKLGIIEIIMTTEIPKYYESLSGFLAVLKRKL